MSSVVLLTPRARSERNGLLRRASMVAIVAGLAAVPADAQLARLRGGSATLGDASGVRVLTSAARPANMREALSRQQSTQERASAMRSVVASARQAAQTAVRAQVENGLGEGGLDPIAEVREAIRLAQAGNGARAGEMLVELRAASDPTGRRTWEGASLPVQTTQGAATTVSITQTESRALLSWDRFDVGAQTTVEFSQKQGGTPQRDWIAVNRVVGSTDPTTVLGQIKADGQVFILNQRGIIFGKGAQVNLRGLLASSLELGNYGDSASFQSGGGVSSFTPLSLQQRNLAFLRNGLLQAAANPSLQGRETVSPLLLSPLFAPGTVQGPSSSLAIFPDLEGDVVVDAGASITALAGGSIILAAPRVDNHGILSAADGQVSLVGGRLVTYARATGEDASRDPNVRGLFLRALDPVRRAPDAPADPRRDNGFVLNRGLIESRRGYLSLVTSTSGEILNEGMLTATTSVARNGKIALYGGTVTIGGAADAAQAGSIIILPDEGGETIPQGSASEPARFKRSQIEIGAAVPTDDDPTTTTVNETLVDTFGRIAPAIVTLGQNALIYAPNANVTIGRRPGDVFDPNALGVLPSRIDILEGATIDVSGLKDIQLELSRNLLTITPVKRNELRDTPNYREVAVGDAFTLNGTTLTVDVRRSGVRADGVRWIGSPLLEAGSLASQIPVTVSELMTEAGEVSLGVNSAIAADIGAIRANPTAAQSVNVARGARIDISGGWVSYVGGEVVTSRLVTADGRVVDIADADPDDAFVSVFTGFTAAQPRFGIFDRFDNPAIVGAQLEGGYDEGRNAGALVINASSARFEGALNANAFAGTRQRASAAEPTRAASIAGDTRRLQGGGGEMPACGLLQIGALSRDEQQLGGDIAIFSGSTRAPVVGVTALSDETLSAAGLSALTLRTTGAVTFETGSNLALAPGGALTVVAGRTIRFDGIVTATSGRIDARTSSFGGVIAGPTPEDRLRFGSIFRDDDDVAGLYAAGAPTPSPYDIIVSGRLSTAGRWTNDSANDGLLDGPGWTDGGAISLRVAPRVLAAIGASFETAEDAADLSGSIRILPGAALDVSAGGYAGIDERLGLASAGGDIALINETAYAGVTVTNRRVGEGDSGTGDFPLGGSNQTVGFTPIAAEGEAARVTPSLIPSRRRARVEIADGSLTSFGFSGGGTFRLVSPDVSFGSDARRDGATHIGLDFAARTGFGALDLTSNRSRFVEGLFDNGRANVSAFRETTSFVVRAGETLTLTQSVLPIVAGRARVDALLALETGASLLSVLTPGVPDFAFDRRALDLTLGGLSELVVDRGGRIAGAPQANITAPKLVTAGTIDLPGGTILQSAIAPSGDVVARALGVRSLGVLLGAESGSDEDAANGLGLTRANGAVLTNAELFSIEGADRLVYLLGRGNEADGILLEAGSVTDLSGGALYDPRAAFLQDSRTGVVTQLRTGRIFGGGSIGTVSTINDEGASATIGLARAFTAAPGAIVDLSGTRAIFDQFVPGRGFNVVEEWSAGGVLAARHGGSIAGARINASGGYGADGGAFLTTGAVAANLLESRALGGTLEWTNPTIAGEARADMRDVLLDDEIERAGFDTLIARGGLRLAGDADLSLGKAFFATSTATRSGRLLVKNSYLISAESGARARISAPYIGFVSRQDVAPYTQLGLRDRVPADPAQVRFEAGAQGIDFVGSTYFGQSIGALSFTTRGDIRLIGVDARNDSQRLSSPGQGALNGEIIGYGDLVFDAARTYATTGTGNLQVFLDAEREGRTAPVAPPAGLPGYNPFLIFASGDSSIRFASGTASTESPLSAGSYVRVLAKDIAQDGHLAAPLGRLELGARERPAALTGALRFDGTETVTFGAGSLTSVSGGDVPIPYGTTLDLIEYYFSPFRLSPLTGLPQAELRMTAGAIDVRSGATVDLSGGGDVFAFEFVSGVGGSRDVLDRVNSDVFSSNRYDAGSGRGLQFADGRQVFAIVPAAQARAIADMDPIYAADYGTGSPADLYGAQAGMSVVLDGADGFAAGEYVLMPAHYALLPGAFRVVENAGVFAPAPGEAQRLRDGSIVVGGSYGVAGSDLGESTRRSFTLQSSDIFGKYSRLETQSGSETIAAQAERKDLPRPRLPLDSARLVLSPLNSLRAAGFFNTSVPAGGRGVQVDIAADDIVIAPAGSAETAGSVTLIDTTLARLNAESLFVGGIRVGNADGTTDLRVDANRLEVRGGVTLAVPELILAVGNERPDGTLGGSRLAVLDGATLTATGLVAGAETADYVIRSFDRLRGEVDKPAGFVGDGSGSGSVIRLGNGAERLVRRTGPGYDRNANLTATFRLGAATLTGENLTIDATRLPIMDGAASLNARNIALIGDDLGFGTSISAALQAKLAAADRLTLRSPEAIQFAGGSYRFNNLTLDAPAISTGAAGDVTISAGRLTLANIFEDAGFCFVTCGAASNDLTISATEITLGSGPIRTYGFGGEVRLESRNGIFYEGVGSLDVGTARLVLITPVLADRAQAVDPREQPVRPEFAFAARGGIVVDGPANNGVTLANLAGNRAPGAQLRFGDSDAAAPRPETNTRDVRIDDALVLATAGVISIDAGRSVDLSGRGVLATPGFTKSFGDEFDRVTVAASGGAIDLLARSGSITLGANATLISDTGIGEAGALSIRAPDGPVSLLGAINPGLAAPRRNDFMLDSNGSAFDLTGFALARGAMFGGEISIRTGLGDLRLDAGRTLRAEQVTLTADGGTLSVAGRIDTSGIDVAALSLNEASKARVNGGAIGLYGRNGVELASSAVLDTHTVGYADADPRSASAGDVTIGIGDGGGAIAIAQGARIDVGARRSQAAAAAGQPANRFVAETAKEAGTLADRTVYRFVQADTGGTVTLRAPLVGVARDQVDIRGASAASIIGASGVQVEAVRRYDLEAIDQTGTVTGLGRNIDGGFDLDPSVDFGALDDQGRIIPYGRNLLTGDFVTEDGLPSVVNFIRNFRVAAADGSDLTGYRLRPGVEFTAPGGVSLISQWNLAAAEIDYQAAFDAGLLDRLDVLDRRLTAYGLTKRLDPYYSLKTGQEGALLDRFANFFYRVDGSARGEAPIVRFRAGGDVRIARSINDGFFVFRDRSDQAWVDYQLGGGVRPFNPALQLSCGLVSEPDCGAVVAFDQFDPAKPRNDQSVRISIVSTLRGSARDTGGIAAPLGPEANSPAALGTQSDFNTGDFAGASIEYGELFPLLPGSIAMRSSDINFAAGTGASLSANPYRVEPGAAGSVVISDARVGDDGLPLRLAYRIQATPPVARVEGDALELRFFRQQEDGAITFKLADFLAQDRSGTDFLLEDLNANSYGTLTWGGPGQGAASEALDPARAYFGPRGRTFLGGANRPNGVIAPLGEILEFLESYAPAYLADLYSGGVRQQLSNPAGQVLFRPSARAHVQTVVRTGEGAINIAAAGDVDLRDSVDPTYRASDGAVSNAANTQAFQAGGVSVYTAGRRVAPGELSARLPGGGSGILTLTSALLEARADPVNVFPTPLLRVESRGVLAQGGGDVAISAGRDVLGRRDLWSEMFRGAIPGNLVVRDNFETGIGLVVRPDASGTPDQMWRTGRIGGDTEVAIAAQYFSAGVGALAGGDVRIDAGRDAADLIVALDSGISTEALGTVPALISWGGGNLDLNAGRDLAGGRFDITSGQARARVGRDTVAVTAREQNDLPTFRIENATVSLRAGREIAGVNATGLGAARADSVPGPNAGLYSAITGFDATALMRIDFTGGVFAPPSLELASLKGGIGIARTTTLYPSAIGQLSVLAGGDIGNLSVAMLDLDPSLLAQSAFASGLDLRPDVETAAGFPGINQLIEEGTRRLYHLDRLTHLVDNQPARIYSEGSISNSSISLAKFGNVRAGLDIIDLFFVGQNVRAGDETRIVAGRDIGATTRVDATAGAKPYFGANGFYLGGPGSFSVEAGRNLGPFVTSSMIAARDSLNRDVQVAYGGGIMTVGNEYNPWLTAAGADLNVAFGVGPGADYDGLREIYLNPANSARLDGDLFVQVTDASGNVRPDRARPVYAPVLARWLEANEPDLFGTVFGRSFGASVAGRAELDAAAYPEAGDLYRAFTGLSPTRQRRFLVNELYFGELQQPLQVEGPSFNQFIRGYRAVDALFPTRLGYTDNLAAYDLDRGTIDADNPLGVPTRRIVDGQPLPADRIETGSADLRLATMQTARGGEITVLAPGGDLLLGSVVRTSEQNSRRNTRFFFASVPSQLVGQIEFGGRSTASSQIESIPLGLEGILTLRGGGVRSFTDGDLRLNQSRLFTNAGGDITAWSSNGDLNAGQGPKSAANFPPVTVRFDLNGSPNEDTAGSISGAGIGAFQQRPDDPPSDIFLVAPVGEIDAGDAGVRASGNIVALAARFANADSLKAGGTISGVPVATVAPPPPAAAASAAAAQVARIADQGRNDDRRSVIVVDVLGFAGGEKCRDPDSQDPDCPK